MIQTLTLEEAAKVLGFKSVQPLRQKARRGEIPGFKAGNRWMFYEPDLINYIRSNYEKYKNNYENVAIKEGNVWHLAKRRIRPTGTHDFQSAVSECKNLRNALRVQKRKNMKICEDKK